MTSRPSRYSLVAISLHWLIALAILFQIMLGWRMGDEARSASTYLVFQLHKSIGITILLLSLVRLAWRLTHPAPPLPDHLKPWERMLAHLTHFGFYTIMIGLPVTGWIMVSASKTNIPTLLFGVVPWPHLPGLPELAPAAKHLWRQIGEAGHGVLAKLTYLLLALHVGGALKHQLIDRDETLGRMLPGVRTPGLLDPVALVAAVVVAAAIAGGQLVFCDVVPPPAKPVTPLALTLPQQSSTGAATVPSPRSADPATPTAATELPAPRPVVRWVIERRSTLGFTASWSGQAVAGRFTRWTADIRFSPDDLDHSSVTVRIDPASASTDDAQRDATLPTEDWFNVAAFPQAVFKSRRIKRSDDAYTAEGDLTLKGVTRPVQLRFSLKIIGDRAVAQGDAALDRTAFAVGQGEFAGTDQIGAAVPVHFALSARAAQ